VSGKGRKERYLLFDDEAWVAVQKYLKRRDELLGVGGNGDILFSRHDREAAGRVLQMGTNSVRWNLDQLCRAAGVAHLTPHQWRHRAATEFYRQTGDIYKVRKFLGHSSVSTTQRYAEAEEKDLIETFAKVHL
jgi:site-specific recombinase XerD